jgi:hypothetical protein|tara:strand:+ start:579 stop:749 length:171 start_codon:yes stop_codon:yes gene_type:complete
MNFKSLGLGILFAVFAAHQFIYLPLSVFSYYLGAVFAVASIGSFISGLKTKKNKKK